MHKHLIVTPCAFTLAVLTLMSVTTNCKGSNIGSVVSNEISVSSTNTNSGSVDSIAIMFYNTENMFDIYSDSITNDNEFTPNGSKHWTSKRYWQKINNIFKVIISADSWEPPAIIALAEVENRAVLEDLIYRTNLERNNYGIVHKDSPDRRGIDVALLYQKEKIRIIETDFFVADGWSEDEFASRYVLRAECEIMNDTLHLFVCHLPSKLGGSLASQKKREAIITTIRSKIDSLSVANGNNVKAMVIGDMNVEYNEEILDILIGNKSNNYAIMHNMVQTQNINEGSYKYQGRWEIIDQVLVSEGVLNGSTGKLFTDYSNYRIIKKDFMLTTDKTYSGKRPLRTYYGYSYEGGYSDHLPILQWLYRIN